MKISEPLSNKLANTSLICAILVVAQHTMLDYVGVRELVSIAVPYFFTASGFLIAGHFERADWYREAVRKRVKSLVLPYFVWFFIGIVITAPLSIAADLMAHRPPWTSLTILHCSPLEWFALDLTKFPIASGHLWYLRALFLLVCVTPILLFLFKRARKVCLFLFFVCYLSYLGALQIESVKSIQWIGIFGVGFSLLGLTYFSAGIMLRRVPETVLLHPDKWVLSCAIGLYASLVVFGYWVVNPVLKSVILNGAIPLLLIIVWSVVPSCPWPHRIVSLSFPIYLLHYAVIPYVQMACAACGSIGPLLVFVIVLIWSVVAGLVLKKHFVSISRIIFGGR